MPAPDFSADPENEPFKLLGIAPTTGHEKAKNRARELYKQVDDQGKQKKINEAMEAIPEREEVNGVLMIELQLKVDTPTITAGDEVTFTVTNDMGDPIERATIRKSADGERVGRTDGNGELVKRLDDTGKGIEFEVEKDHPESDKTYRIDTVEVEIERKTISLQFDEYPDSATVGDTIPVRVTNGDSGVRNCQLSLEGAQIGTTDGNGEADVTIPSRSVGTMTLKATRGKGASRKYTDATEKIDVYKRQVGLELEQAPDTVSVGETATFRVTDGSSPVAGAEVSHDRDSDTTDSSGYATLSFADLPLGSTEVQVTKSDEGGVSYKQARHSVTVTERTQALDLSLADSNVVVHRPCTFEVTSEGQPVEGAMVSASDADRVWTDGNGEAELTFERAGPKRVEAIKQDDPKVNYGTDDIRIEVDRTTERLSLDIEDNDIKVGNDIEVTVEGDGGRPVQGVAVSPDNGRGDTTDNFGEASISFSEDGRQRVAFSKEDDDTTEYIGDDVYVHVKERPKELEIVSAPDTRIGDPVPIEVHDHTDQPVQGVTVTVTGGGVSKEQTTDPNGVATFYITDVNPPQFMEATAVDFDGEYDTHTQDYFRIDG